MPLTKREIKIKGSMIKEYGIHKGTRIFAKWKNKRKATKAALKLK